MKRRLLLVLALCGALGAQEKPKTTQRIYEVKHVNVKDMADLVQIPGGPVIRYNEYFKTISMFGSTEQVDEVQEILKYFDVARPETKPNSRNIELTAYMLIGAPKGTAGEAVPPDLDPVVKQLKAAFGYNDFRLLESATIRTRDQQGMDTSGQLSLPSLETTAVTPPGSYNLRAKHVSVGQSERGPVVRVDDFRIGVRVPVSTGPNSTSMVESGFSTDIDLRPEQKIVVGKANVAGLHGAFIVVLTAKVAD